MATYKQILKPRLDTTGTIGNCKIYARSFFGIPSSGKYPTAWSNWLGSKTQHKDRNIPKDVVVPVWFSGAGGDGHVVVSVPNKGFFSSPWQKNTNHAVLKSIEDIERLYKVKYAGWTEDIEGKQVIKRIGEDVMPSAQDVKDYFKVYENREPTAKEIADYTNPKRSSHNAWRYLMDKLLASREAEIKKLKAQSGDTGEATLIGKALIALITKFGYKK